MEIRENALKLSKSWQFNRKKNTSSYDAPTSTDLDTSYSIQKNIKGYIP